MALWSKVDNEAGKPKYLSDTLVNGQSVSDKDATLGVDAVEAQVTANRAKGLKSPGWTMYRTYTDAQGNTRHKAEVLVAMGDTLTGDDDTLAPEITISGQPASATVFSGATATFSVTATRTGTGTLTYQWEKQESGAGAWTAINGATSASYTTGALTVAADNTDKYRVVVSLSGAQSVTSNAATLTVNPAVITISAQPTNQSVTEPATATFSVTASVTGGATLSYQWEKFEAGGSTWSPISGATSASYTTGATTVGDDNGDDYRVVVSANKEADSVTSNSAQLAVTV